LKAWKESLDHVAKPVELDCPELMELQVVLAVMACPDWKVRAWRVNQVCRVITAKEARRVIPDVMDRKVNADCVLHWKWQTVWKEQRVIKARRASQDLRVWKDCPATRVQLVSLDLRVVRVHQVKLDLLVLADCLAFEATKVTPVLMVSLEALAEMEHVVSQDSQDWREPRANKAYRWLALLAPKVIQVCVDPKVNVAFPATVVWTDYPAL
jgi:hypothetical protein